ncbi:MAG: YlbF family regulator, partial [Clostridia bacterium]|nr:YlbF family regulator [Clostridia bacterium]
MDIFEMAAALGDALKQDEKLVALEAARKNYMEDRKLQALVVEYEVQQTAMQKEASRGED